MCTGPTINPRLLVILPWFDIGGAEKFMLDLFGRLAARGWSLTAVSDQPSPHRWLSEFRKYSDDLHTMDGSVAPEDQPAFIRELIRLRKPDVVLVTQSRLGFLLLPYLRLACPGPVYVDYCHVEESWGGGGYSRMAAELDPLIDLHMVTSQHLKAWLVDHGADPNRTEVCTVNIDPNAWRPDPETRRRVRQARGIADDEPIVFFAGRITQEKQPRVLAGALRECIRRGIPLRALIAGDGEARAWLQRDLQRSGIASQCEMLGMVGSREVHDLLAASDIFFLPSRWEGIAISVFEAMAMEVAVLGADVGGQSELVTPDCGILVKPSDEMSQIQEYAKQLAWLIEHPAERRSLARRARERIERHFTLDQMRERIEGLLSHARTHPREFPASADPDIAGRCAACAVKALSGDAVRLDFWREDLNDELIRADSTGIAAMFRAYWERMTMQQIESMPSWRVYQKIARWTCRDWSGLSVADQVSRFESSFVRRILNQIQK